MTGSTVAAVVVAFNRKLLLAECLDGLLRQSSPLAAIFVVDNASSDGTAEHLHDKGYLAQQRIHYLRLDQNTGGAGGFYHGMRAASQAGHDWIWLMDDDTEPYTDALEKMLPLGAHPEVVAIANRKVDVHRNLTLDGLRLFGGASATSLPYPKVRMSSFVGLLVRGSAVRAIGFPRPEFFIHNDDLEYCMRLLTIGNIALATTSTVMHKEQARQIEPKHLFGFSYLPKDIVAYCSEYYGFRNYTVAHQEHAGPFKRLFFPVRRFLIAASAILLFDKDHRWLRLKILARAHMDGFRKHFDNAYPVRLRNSIQQSQAGRVSST